MHVIAALDLARITAKISKGWGVFVGMMGKALDATAKAAKDVKTRQNLRFEDVRQQRLRIRSGMTQNFSKI
jgi:hypothetical protein